ncbi:hypothetical protein Fmac_008005 [Flemingia macrophylla]|uniref:Uncharacterized protein n=1 Tax=Flemingia macrophylla TaxID=520843 RepID=A0ABD1MW68_9FABA
MTVGVFCSMHHVGSTEASEAGGLVIAQRHRIEKDPTCLKANFARKISKALHAKLQTFLTNRLLASNIYRTNVDLKQHIDCRSACTSRRQEIRNETFISFIKTFSFLLFVQFLQYLLLLAASKGQTPRLQAIESSPLHISNDGNYDDHDNFMGVNSACNPSKSSIENLRRTISAFSVDLFGKELGTSLLCIDSTGNPSEPSTGNL